MSQAKQNKTYKTFVRGLMTEASPLTYPEDTSFDELNTVPTRKGNRTRRFGINYNPDNIADVSVDTSKSHTEFVWKTADNNVANTFLVVQNGSTVHFYNRKASSFAAGLKTYTIDLNTYCRPGVSDASGNRCQYASGKGYLFIVGEDIEPLAVTYDTDTDTFTTTPIVIQGRDFEGLNDGLANDAEPTTLSTSHFYNLLNQGWIKPGVY